MNASNATNITPTDTKRNIRDPAQCVFIPPSNPPVRPAASPRKCPENPAIDRAALCRHVWRAMSENTAPASVAMETLVGLCKRRGFIFQSSEIYGGLNGFFDYGPLGVELKRNIRDCWWRDMVQRRDDVVGLESSIIMHPKVWQASGHVDGFTDPLVDC